MNNIPVNNGGYTNFSDLSALRREATSGDGVHALEQAAQQFEALFLQMMLKSMREAGGGDGLFDNEHTRLYQDMFDKELSLNLSQGDNGIGLAKVLVQQLKATIPSLNTSSEASSVSNQTQGFAVPARGSVEFRRDDPDARSGLGEANMSGKNMPPAEVQQSDFASAEEFVERLWPYAKQIAEKLGVDPRAVMAQAALETGWGRAVIQHPDGSSSYNLFNIKADQRWSGEQVNKLTLEYRDGVAAREQASFRSYGSYAESFEDYAHFLQGNGRYQQALQSGPDIALFSERLQQAGYATDPAYASKIQRIAQSELINAGQAGLKNSASETLS